MIRKRLGEKEFVIGIILLFIGASILPSISGDIREQKDIAHINDLKSEVSSTTDWWPMFHHDLNLTGYTTSTAPSTNKVLWTKGTWDTFWDDAQRSAPAIVDGRIYIGAISTLYPLVGKQFDENQIYKSPFRLHEIPSGENPSHSRMFEASVECLDSATGNTLWKTFLPDQHWIWGPPAVDDGKVYITSSIDMSLDHGQLYCLDAQNGNILWNFSIQIWDYTTPIVSNGKVYLPGFVSSGWPKINCHLYCLDEVTGAVLYNVILGNGSPIDSPTLNEGRLYISVWDRETMKNYLYCVNSSNGIVLWSKNLKGDYPGSSPVLYDNTVIVSSTFGDENTGNFSGVMWCFDTESGADRWNYTTDNVCNIWTTPAIAKNKIYFASSRVWDGTDKNGLGEIFCLNASTGNLLWNKTLGDFLYSSPAIADGKIYINSMKYWGLHGDVYCLDTASGDIIWQYWLWQGSYSSPAIAEGRLYVATPFCIYAFDDSAPSSNPPTLQITGSHWGMPNVTYTFTFSGIAPEGHDMSLIITWPDVFPGYIFGPLYTGEPLPIPMISFGKQGENWISARAQDIVSHVWSNWTIFKINISVPKQMFLFGFINHVEKESDYTIMNATFVFHMQFSPFKVGFLSSGDQIITLNNSTGHAGSRFIVGRFQAVIN